MNLFSYRQKSIDGKHSFAAYAWFSFLIAVVFAGSLICFSCARPDAKEFEDYIKNFGEVNDYIYRGAQPKEEAFALLKQQGVKTVVNLRNNDKEVEKERQWAQETGLKYITIPMSGFSRPSDEDIDKFIKIVSGSGGPFFVHCKRGQERTGTAIACYRIAHDKWTADEAYAEMKKYHFRPFWFAHLKKYVYDFAKRTQQKAE